MKLRDSYLRHRLQNLLLGVGTLQRLARRWHHMGMGRDPDRILPVFVQLAAMVGRPLQDLTLVELGPGQTPDLLVGALLLGARQAIGLDVNPYLAADTRDTAQYGQTRAWIADAMQQGRLGPQPGYRPDRYADQARIAAPDLRLELYDGWRFPLADASVDVVWSKSVLEHVPRYREVLAENWRVLRPGGVAAHIVDLRDHLTLHNGQDWLRFLRYSEPRWERMASHRSSWCNRLRLSDWQRLIGELPWQVSRFEVERQPLHADFSRAALDPRFRDLPADELQVSWIAMALRKPPAQPGPA